MDFLYGSTILLIGSFLPAFLILYFIYDLDDHTEPLKRVIQAFLLGVLSPILTLQLSTVFDFNGFLSGNPVYTSIFLAAIPEEVGRFLLLFIICKNWSEVDEPFDCVVYAAAIWAGFSAVETSLYAINEASEGGDAIHLMGIRASLCTLGHVSYGVIVGAYTGIALFAQRGVWPWILRGLTIAIFLHALYDAILLSQPKDGAPLWGALFAVIADGLTIVLALLFLFRMDRLQKISSFEGEQAQQEAMLLIRHRPDNSIGLWGLISGIGFVGLFLLLVAMVTLSNTFIYLCQTVITFNPIMALLTVICGAISLKTWKSVLKRVATLSRDHSHQLERDISRRAPSRDS